MKKKTRTIGDRMRAKAKYISKLQQENAELKQSNRIDNDYEFKYCPFCGKKIKCLENDKEVNHEGKE